MHIRWMFGLAVLCLSFSAGALEYRCTLLPEAPTLDGGIDGDPAWESAQTMTDFRVLGEERTAPKQTHFWLGYTEAGLYAAIRCEEPDMNDIEAVMSDGEAIWEEDSVELFIRPDDSQTYQFVVNAAGSRASPNTLTRWEAATGFEEAAWTVEIFIPWEITGVTPGPDTPWRFNVCRTVLTLPEGKQHTTWAHLESTFHEVDAYHPLYFEGLTDNRREAIARHIEENAIKPYRFVLSKPRTGLISLSSEGEKRILFNQGAELVPRISPDGASMLYTSIKTDGNTPGVPGIWLSDFEGEARRLCDGRRAAWQPDGGRFVFERDGRIFERAIEGAEEREIPVQKMTWPEYHPQGGFLFVGDSEPYLYRMHGDGTLEKLIRTHGGPARVSPDGRFVALRLGPHIHAFDLETKETRQLTFQPGVQSYPIWSEDSRSLCYVSSADPFVEQYPFSAQWNLYLVELDHPLIVKRLHNRINPSFDWHGGEPMEMEAIQLRGGPLRLRSGGGETSPLRVETAWYALHFDADAGFLKGRDRKYSEDPVRMTMLDRAGQAITMTPEGQYDGEGDCRISLGHGAALTHAPNSPVIRATGDASAAARLSLQTSADVLIVPDRFGDDLLLFPADLPDTAARLPKAPFYLLPLHEGNSLLVLIPSEAGAAVETGETGLTLHAFLDSSDTVLALLENAGFWMRLEAKPGEEDLNQVSFRSPFHAQWRCATRAGTQFAARMWCMLEMMEFGRDPLPLPRPFGQAPDHIFFYAYGRGLLTPHDVWTPLDVLYDRRLDHEPFDGPGFTGLLHYRPLDLGARELSTRSHDWSPFLGHLESPFFGVLEILSGVFLDNTPGVHELAGNLTGDVLELLRGLDVRRAHYREAFLELAARAEADLPEAAALLREALEQEEALPCPALDSIAEMIEALKDRIGQHERMYWNGDVLARDDFYNRFRKACQESAGERQAIIAVYRQAARDARNAAGRAILTHSGLAESADRLRDDIAALLGFRWFMEGDWRGETPYSKGDPLPWY